MDSVYKIILIAISFFLGVFVTMQCSDEINSITNKVTIKDSTVVKVVIDTIPFDYPVPVIVEKENPKFDSTKFKECAVLTKDSIDVSDTLIKGFVKTQVKNNQLKNLVFSYKPLFPKYIKKDSIVEKYSKETVHEPYKQNILYAGGSVGTNDLGVSLALKNKKDLVYGYRFAMTYQGLKTHNIEFKVPIYKSKHKNK